ncbi:hypothetical protein [Vibrio navarrensis]|uniref:hypothetical protein n=1 Tax=Vibrio navarrensis TaxID=29495 RepID=UPI001EEA6F6E|nr:hypothetical protein [Vibrio navarrensis]
MAHSVKTSQHTDFLSYLCTPSLEQAFSTLCKRRRHFPSNSDIWHLRFHWQQRKVTLAQQLVSGSYRLQPMKLIQKSDGSRCALAATLLFVVPISEVTMRTSTALCYGNNCAYTLQTRLP